MVVGYFNFHCFQSFNYAAGSFVSIKFTANEQTKNPASPVGSVGFLLVIIVFTPLENYVSNRADFKASLFLTGLTNYLCCVCRRNLFRLRG